MFVPRFSSLTTKGLFFVWKTRKAVTRRYLFIDFLCPLNPPTSACPRPRGEEPNQIRRRERIEAMKHIFKKLHFGNSSSSSHDPGRSSNDASTPTPLCSSDHRTSSGQTPGHSPASPSSSSPSPASATTPASAAAATAPDYFSSEEEFQVQLALAISASNSEFRDGDDRDTDQIRAATLLSLGRIRIDSVREGEEAAVSLSRQYWVGSLPF